MIGWSETFLGFSVTYQEVDETTATSISKTPQDEASSYTNQTSQSINDEGKHSEKTPFFMLSDFSVQN